MGPMRCQTFAIMMFFMLLFPGCLSEDNSDLEQRIEDLEKQIEDQEQIIHNHSINNQISSAPTVSIVNYYTFDLDYGYDYDMGPYDYVPPSCDENGCNLNVIAFQHISGGQPPYEQKWYFDGVEVPSYNFSVDHSKSHLRWYSLWPIMIVPIQLNTNETHNVTSIVHDSNNHSASSSYIFSPTIQFLHRIGDFALRVEGVPEGETVRVSATFAPEGDYEAEAEDCEFYVVSNGSILWDDYWQEHRCELGTYELPITWNMTVCVTMGEELVDVYWDVSDEASCVYGILNPYLGWEYNQWTEISFNGLDDGDNNSFNGLLRLKYGTRATPPEGEYLPIL